MSVCISISLAAASMVHLAVVIKQLEAAKADYIHFDVEDGNFVRMMTLGTKLIKDLRPLTALPFDVHLMMVNPDWLIPQLAVMGADRVSVHFEACPYPRKTLRAIADLGMRAGLAFNPSTPLPDNLHYLFPYLSFITILTSEPEWPDSPYLPEILDKLLSGKKQAGLEGVEWVVDGGIEVENIKQVTLAGADTLVIGRAVFQQGEISANLQRLRAAIQ